MEKVGVFKFSLLISYFSKKEKQGNFQVYNFFAVIIRRRTCSIHEHFHLDEPGVRVPGHTVGDHAGKGDQRLGPVSEDLEEEKRKNSNYFRGH